MIPLTPALSPSLDYGREYKGWGEGGLAADRTWVERGARSYGKWQGIFEWVELLSGHPGSTQPLTPAPLPLN
jgi:hypothetical protein